MAAVQEANGLEADLCPSCGATWFELSDMSTAAMGVAIVEVDLPGEVTLQ